MARKFRGVAQLVEHRSPKPGVGSSSLSTRAKKIYLRIMKLINYFKESYSELVHKTAWPTRQELTNSAVVVLVASLLIALVVWAMDSGFESIMTFIYNKVL